MIEISGNIIIEEGQLLLLYREDGKHWEVPGGKVKTSESPTDAAKREAEEEINVSVTLDQPFYSGEFQHDGQLFLWHGYISKIEGEAPEPAEKKVSELKWVDSKKLDKLELAPNLKMIEPSLRKLLK